MPPLIHRRRTCLVRRLFIKHHPDKTILASARPCGDFRFLQTSLYGGLCYNSSIINSYEQALALVAAGFGHRVRAFHFAVCAGRGFKFHCRPPCPVVCRLGGGSRFLETRLARDNPLFWVRFRLHNLGWTQSAVELVRVHFGAVSSRRHFVLAGLALWP
jgi:hypothetical protein